MNQIKSHISFEKVIPYYSYKVFNYLFELAAKDNIPLTPFKAIKIVYISHGWHLALAGGQPLINEKVEAWQYGPVIPSLYHQLKKYGRGPVRAPITQNEINVLDATLLPEKDLAELVYKKKPVSSKLTSLQELIVGAVWRKYKLLSVKELGEIVHKQGTPWYKVYIEDEGRKFRHAIIPDDLISDHYKSLIPANDEEEDRN